MFIVRLILLYIFLSDILYRFIEFSTLVSGKSNAGKGKR
jgi:hypothetical protein